MAGGGTTSFCAALIVSKKYNFAAAVSLTHDNRIDFTILCELDSIFLDENGIMPLNICTHRYLKNRIKKNYS